MSVCLRTIADCASTLLGIGVAKKRLIFSQNAWLQIRLWKGVNCGEAKRTKLSGITKKYCIRLDSLTETITNNPMHSPSFDCAVLNNEN